tara:strand:+ start:2710 stop:3759 length:1050 start_codon:yes stop_codon:yes gene_type:complete
MQKKIIIFGNLGYIGPVLVKHLRSLSKSLEIVGYDNGLFQGCLLNPEHSYERYLSSQIYGDIRFFNNEVLKNADAVICLAAISNDPIGKAYEKQTIDINATSSIELAKAAKKAGVKKFIYASSCSVYGIMDKGIKSEESQLNPLTAYSKSKILCENGLKKLISKEFSVTCLRFSTACGYSPRLRLDLVLNDFVASALINKKIELLSDGSAWRPIIDVKDMSRSIVWAINRDIGNRGFLALNIGKDSWNFTIKDLAESVKNVIPNVDISYVKDALPDKRSYKVDFSLFKFLAPEHQPIQTIYNTIKEIADGITNSNFKVKDFRKSHLVRLNTLNYLREQKLINGNLEWIN